MFSFRSRRIAAGGSRPERGGERLGGWDGGAAGVTNGGDSGTNGKGRRVLILAWLAFAAIGSAFAVVNSVSELSERARMGRHVETWEPWCWELTSLAGWLTVAPAILFASALLRPPRLSWPLAAAAHLLLTVPAAGLHIGLMIALRHVVYALLSDDYSGGGPLLDVLVYEYRKDLVTYASLVLLPFVVAGLLQARQPAATPSDDFRIEVRDGSRTVWLSPADIEWAQAAGNYVELTGGFGTLLHRRTLAALEEELGPYGFRRIHRARIVRADAVRAIETRPSGDFDVSLASGARVAGSRRYRDRL